MNRPLSAPDRERPARRSRGTPSCRGGASSLLRLAPPSLQRFPSLSALGRHLLRRG